MDKSTNREFILIHSVEETFMIELLIECVENWHCTRNLGGELTMYRKRNLGGSIGSM